MHPFISQPGVCVFVHDVDCFIVYLFIFTLKLIDARKPIMGLLFSNFSTQDASGHCLIKIEALNMISMVNVLIN